MKIAIPTTNQTLDQHFGHAQEFSFFATEGENVTFINTLAAPPHQPGVLPKWLINEKVNIIIAGGIGGAAIDILNKQNITVITGAPAIDPMQLAQSYAKGELQSKDSVCTSHLGCESH